MREKNIQYNDIWVSDMLDLSFDRARLLFTSAHSKQTQTKMEKQIGCEAIICFPSIRLDSIGMQSVAHMCEIATEIMIVGRVKPSIVAIYTKQFNYNNGSISILCV